MKVTAILSVVVLANIGVIAAVDCSTFQQLSLQNGAYVAEDAAGGQHNYHYPFNICGNINNPPTDFAQCAGFASCQYDFNQNPPSFVAHLGQGVGTWSTDGDAYVYTVSNGEKCGSTPRVFNVKLHCGNTVTPSTIIATESGSESCTYLFDFPTSLACGNPNNNNPDGGGGGGKSDTGGWVFFGLVIGLLFAYFVIGCVLGYKKNEGQGGPRDWCPHPAFWFAIPGLVKDGCIFSWGKTKDLVQKCTGGSGSSDYETVE